MRFFSYRNKRIMRTVGLIVLSVVLVLTLIVIGRISYLGRFVVYTDEGVILDKEQSITRTDAPSPEANPADYPFSTLTPVTAEEGPADASAMQLSGYYISTTMLADQLDEVLSQVDELDDTVNAVILDVKSPLGNFYYSTQLPDAYTADADIAACDALIQKLTANPDLVVIARVPAFSDPNYITDHYAEGLQVYGGLWMDERRCYWMDPTYTGVHDYLLSIALELEGLGFDEVLFDNFYVPDDGTVLWNDEVMTRQAALLSCADDLFTNLTGSSIRLMLGTSDVTLAPYCSRFFIHAESVADLTERADAFASAFSDPAASVVYLTNSHDTHFEAYGLIRPLLSDEASEFPEE